MIRMEIALLLIAMLLPVHYAVTDQGNYSDGIYASVCLTGKPMAVRLQDMQAPYII